nr:heme exporter protein D [Mucilaginibacter sp. X4EP1]
MAVHVQIERMFRRFLNFGNYGVDQYLTVALSLFSLSIKKDRSRNKKGDAPYRVSK